MSKTLDSVISEIKGYLQAASESTMSRNNAENLALELLDDLEKVMPADKPEPPKESDDE